MLSNMHRFTQLEKDGDRVQPHSFSGPKNLWSYH